MRAQWTTGWGYVVAGRLSGYDALRERKRGKKEERKTTVTVSEQKSSSRTRLEGYNTRRKGPKRALKEEEEEA